MTAWLERGGRFESYVRINLRGSHMTPSRLLGLIGDEGRRAKPSQHLGIATKTE